MKATDFDPTWDWSYAVVKAGADGTLFDVDLQLSSDGTDVLVDGEWMAPGVAKAISSFYGFVFPDDEDMVTITGAEDETGSYILTITGTLADGTYKYTSFEFVDPLPIDLFQAAYDFYDYL